jgi:hypothetical protein
MLITLYIIDNFCGFLAILDEQIKLSLLYIMDNIDNKILPIELAITNTNVKTIIMNKQSRIKRCRNGSRRNRKTHRCRKVIKK